MFLFRKKQQEKKYEPRTFKQLYPYEKRVERRLKFQEKYAKEKYALIVVEGLHQFDHKASDFTIMGVELHFTILMLMQYIRLKVLKVGKGSSFFVKIRNQLRKTTDNIGELYQKCVDEDGFMYVQLRQESIF